MSLRERNRRNTLVVTQRTAVELFVARGFDQVKVVEIAAAVGMAPSTLYRYFPTKEAIVLWDEYADEYSAAMEEALTRLPPFAALREAFASGLAGRYESDAEFQLQRMTLIYQTPALHPAATEAYFADHEELTTLLEPHLSAKHRAAASLLASAALLAAEWAVDQWQATAAARPLGELVAEAFDHLSQLDELA